MENTPLDTIRQMLHISPQAQVLLEDGVILASSPEAQRLFPNILKCTDANAFFGPDMPPYDREKAETGLFFSTNITGRRCDVTVTALPPYQLCTIVPAAPESTEALRATAQYLRQPLASMMALAPKLLPRLEALNDPKLLPQAAAMQQSLYQIMRLTDNLDVYTALIFQPVRFDLRQYFEGLEAQLIPLCRDSGRTLELRYPRESCLCTADPELLTQALMNLLSNALKFSAPESPIILTCKKQKENIIISIRDRGQGIPPDELRTAFFRSEHRGQIPNPQWGAGLGLWVARKIVEAHGGRLLIESRENLGTTVHISMRANLSARSTTLCDSVVPVTAGGINPILSGLSDVLPASAFDVIGTC